MKTHNLARLGSCLLIAMGILPCGGQSHPEPDVDPTGNAGAFKVTVGASGYNPHNGNATRSITDLHVPGAPGVYGLDFTRHWNSADESFGADFLEPRAFGAGGWTHSWNWTASVDREDMPCDAEVQPCGGLYITYIHIIKIQYPDGRTGRFYFSRSNLTPPSEDPDPSTPEPYPAGLSGSIVVDDHLVVDPPRDGGHFWLYLADGGAVLFERFDSGYRGTKVIDPHGLATILSYESDENGDRLSRVAGPDGRSLFITWGFFGGTTPTVIRKVGWGRTPGLLFQTVEYCYTPYSLGTFVWYALTSASYIDDINSGQQVKATYTYTPWASQGTTDIMPAGLGPLLTTADDPRFEGAMTRIRYVFRGGPGGQAPCLHTNPAPLPGSIGPPVLMAAFPVEKELSLDTGLLISELWIPCNATMQTGMRRETRGAGGSRIFLYGRAGGLEPGAWWEEIPNGPDIWHPPEANPTVHGYGTGTEIARLTDFSDSPDPAITPTDFRHPFMAKPWRSFDSRGFLTQYTFQRGPAYPGPTNNGRIKEIWHRDADNTKRTYNWDNPTPGSSVRDAMHLPNTYNHWLFSQTDERNNTTTYTRDSLRRVTQIAYYEGAASGNPVATESFTYNEFNQVATHTLPSGVVQHYDYEGSRLWREWNSVDTIDEATIYTFDALDRVRTAQNSRARAAGKSYSAWMEYNARHQVTKVHYPSTGGSSDPAVIYEYDKYGNCTAITNELGYRSTYTYDSYRRCTSYTEPVNACGVASRTWNWVYDRIATNGPRDASTHTSNKWRLQIEPPYNSTGDRRATVRHYDYNDRVSFEFIGARIPAGSPGNWDYDHGAMHSYTYDKNGNKETYTDPQGRETIYEYDKRNRLVKTTEKKNPGRPVNQITRHDYDATGNKTKVTFPDFHTQHWLSHDPFGQPRQFKDERANITDLAYQWGPMKKLDTVRTYREMDDGAGTETQLTNFDYDEMGRPTRTVFPDTTTEVSTYDLGQLKTWKTRRNQVKTITLYDARGREKSHIWSDGTAGITRQWDDASRLLGLANRFSAIDYTYDNAGQVLVEGNILAGGAGESAAAPKEVRYCRFPSGEVSQLIYPNGFTVQRGYTVRKQLDGVGWGADSVSYAYMADGRVDYQAYHNGVTTDFDYDARGFIQSVLHQHGSSNLSKRTYYRDDRDRITAWQKDVNQGVNPMENGRGDRYHYDQEGQLYAASYQAEDPSGSAANPLRNDIFQYDALGNRKEANHLASRGWMNVTRRNNGLNQYRMWAPNCAVYYDDSWGTPPAQFPSAPWVPPGNGVTMADGWITASYNALNQPIAMGNPDFGNTFLLFGHDPLGRCVKRWMISSTGDPLGPAMYFYYDGWNLVEERSGANNPVRLYVHGGRVDEIVAQITPNNGWLRYFHYDARGHCTLQTDAFGNIVEQYEYDAFGLPYFYDMWGNSMTVEGRPGSVWGNRFLFTGREWLGELRLYDFRNRHYQPELGRFLQPDPIQFAAGDYNLYRYCHNDPVNKSDPTGLSFIGKILRFVIVGAPKGEKTLNKLETMKDAVRAQKEGEDITMKSEKLAREVARQGGDGATPIKEVDKATGKAHYHDAGRQGGHVLYSIAGALTISGSLPPESGAFERGGAFVLDLFNPLSLLQDVLDVRDAIKERNQ